MQSAGIRGENAPDLAKAVAQATADALSMFLNQAMVAPGIPAAAPPPPGSGSTAGPGTLMPPPVGGPIAPQLEGLALSALNSNGIKGQDAPGLGKVIAGAIAQGIMMFTTQVKVAPGIAVAGFATSAPGNLM
jgi:hypothetical protein